MNQKLNKIFEGLDQEVGVTSTASSSSRKVSENLKNAYEQLESMNEQELEKLISDAQKVLKQRQFSEQQQQEMHQSKVNSLLDSI